MHKKGASCGALISAKNVASETDVKLISSVGILIPAKKIPCPHSMTCDGWSIVPSPAILPVSQERDCKTEHNRSIFADLAAMYSPVVRLISSSTYFLHSSSSKFGMTGSSRK